MTTIESNAELLLSVSDFRLALAGAAWDMDLPEFCKAIGWPEDDYARAKFKRFQAMGTSIGVFDDMTLTQIVLAQRASAARRRTIPR